ncbi:MAG: glycosyltransferase family 4 protein [Myxococcota bacterium]
MPSEPRVLVLNERDAGHPKAGGAEVHVTEIFKRLAARGCDITLTTTSFPGGAPCEMSDGIRIRRLGRIRYYYPRVVLNCARETRRGRYDIVVECLNKLPYYAPAYSKVPVVAIAHHLFGESAFLQVQWPVAATVWAAERAIPWLYRKVPFVSISESTRDDLVARGLPREHIEVHHCGIRRPRVEAPPYTSRAPRIVYTGRLERYKQIDVLLHAAARLSDRFPQVRLDIVGRGSDRERLEILARDLGVAERTHFVGFVSDDERDRLLAAARVNVCPSAKEGWGLTVIEANALGTPVVATDAPGLRDSVEEGTNGYLVPDGDVDAFVDRIARILGDDALASRLSTNALGWSLRFDWDVAADRMAATIEAARRSA